MDHSLFVLSMKTYSSIIIPSIVLFSKVLLKNVVGRSVDAPAMYLIMVDIPTDIMFFSISFVAGVASHSSKMSPLSTEVLLFYLLISIFVIIIWRFSGGLISRGGLGRLIWSAIFTILNYIISLSALAHALAVTVSKV